MAHLQGQLVCDMVAYEGADHGRVNHFLKVYAYARTIALQEGLDCQQQEILELAAILHDVGIKVSEEKYGSGAGKYQEIEGPPIAREMLQKRGAPREWIERVSYLVGHHHTYHDVQGMDYQILLEADFLVNIEEGGMPLNDKMRSLFKTQAGKALLCDLFGG